MIRNALVTGCNGFVGRYLCRRLIAEGTNVVGIDLHDECLEPALDYYCMNLNDAVSVKTILGNDHYDEVYHLAAVANPREANETPYEAISTGVLSTLNILEVCRHDLECKVIFIGSSEEYKKINHEEIILNENSALDTMSIYGASKIAAETIALAYARRFGVKAFFTRSFNHTGPGQSPLYVMSDFAKQIAEAKLGLRDSVINTGTIDIERDFLDVRDVIRAYQMIVRYGKVGEIYNVSSGQSVSLRDCIIQMAEYVGLDSINIVIDQSRIRGSEPKRIIGDNYRLIADTKWGIEVPIRKALQDLVEYWIEEYENG